MKEDFANFVIRLAEITFGSLVLGVVLNFENLSKAGLLIGGTLFFMLLGTVGFALKYFESKS